jgi:hypothetical protein
LRARKGLSVINLGNESGGLIMIRVLDPTNEGRAPGGQPAARPATLEGATVGFISNGKEGTKGYFTQLERLLREELGVAAVVWRTKSNYSAPADPHIVDEIKRWQAVVTGVGD